jgi:hypothetical protein
MKESDLQQAVHAWLEEDGWSVEGQWPLGSKRIDLVASRAHEVRSFEIKVKDWRRAARQAFLNAPYFHRSFVVLPANTQRQIDLQSFTDLGIGLMEVSEDGTLIELLSSPRSDISQGISAALRDRGVPA